MKTIRIVRVLVVLSLMVFSGLALAHPEYAVRYNIMSCTACHYSETGGGPRNIEGKLFGAHGFKINPFLVQDYVSADFRAIYYYPQRATAANGGAGVMSGSVAGHLPLDADQRIHLIVEQNVAGFSKAPSRDTYGLFQLAPPDGAPHAFEALMVGRFRPAFGIVTDEHRTYTRIQTATEWYTFQTGAQLSGTPTSQLHYDIALVNGEENTGTTFGAGEAERFGSYLNVRYMPTWVMFGASAQYHDRKPERDSPNAFSLYTIASLARATWNRLPADIRLEYVEAKNFDSNLGNGFVNNSAYVTQLGAARSRGVMAWFDYALTSKLTLIYKYDFLVPDMAYPADYYDRHGIGFRWFIGPGVMIQARTEFARATNPSEANATGEGGQNATYAILQMEL